MEDIIMSGWTGPTGTLSFTNTSGNQEGKVYNAKTQTIVKYKRDFDFQDLGSEVAARYRYQYKDISTPWCKLTITGDNAGLNPVQVHWESNIALSFDSWVIYFTGGSSPLQTWTGNKTSVTQSTIGNFSVMDFDHIEITFTQPVNNASIASALTTGKGVATISFDGTENMFNRCPVLNSISDLNTYKWPNATARTACTSGQTITKTSTAPAYYVSSGTAGTARKTFHFQNTTIGGTQYIFCGAFQALETSTCPAVGSTFTWNTNVDITYISMEGNVAHVDNYIAALFKIIDNAGHGGYFWYKYSYSYI